MRDATALAAGSRGERGAALVVVLLAVLLLAALGAGAILTASTDVLIAANFRDAREVLYAADAAVGRAVSDLAAQPDWTAVVSGAVQSSFVDGPPGYRTLPDGATLDLAGVIGLAGCGRAAGCTDAELDAVTPERPWGPDNPRWRLWGYGPSGRLGPEAPGDRACYLVLLVADDPSEADGDPSRDGEPGEPGSGVVLVRVEAFGVRGLRQTVEATVARVTDESGGSGDESESRAPDTSGGGDAARTNSHASAVRLLSWRWIR